MLDRPLALRLRLGPWAARVRIAQKSFHNAERERKDACALFLSNTAGERV